MKQLNLSNLLIPLMATLAIYFPLSNASPFGGKPISFPSPTPLQTLADPAASPMPKGKKNKTTKTDDEGRLPGEAAKLLCDFFGDYRSAGGGMRKDIPLSADATSLKGDYCQLKLIPKLNFSLEFLIATVPDPKESRLDHIFDRHVDAIQHAVEAAGYVLDRHWLPWERAKTSATATAGSAAQTPPRQTLEPGVLVFRRNEFLKGPTGSLKLDAFGKPIRDDSLLLVFLVGETPTYGIHKLAFQNALAQVERFSTLNKPNTQQQNTCGFSGASMRILGPTFSGSATSLALSLRSWLDQKKALGLPLSKACLISGSATAINKPEFLNLIGEHQGNVQFFATIIPEQEARKAFFKYLAVKNMPMFLGAKKKFNEYFKPMFREDSLIMPTQDPNDIDRTHIALLTEATTSYGQKAGQDVLRNNQRAVTGVLGKDQQRSPSKSPSAEPMPTPSPDISPLILKLTFPLHISQLRIEAAKNKNGHTDASGTMPMKESHLTLPTGESNDQRPKDIVLPYSPMEAVTSELMLSEILLAIHRDRVRYVGLSATDVLDRAFLIHEIREHCPNAVIFTFSSDLLYLHSEANMDAQGVLVVTPYPLFAQNQVWTYPFTGRQARMQFTTQTAQGVYNAALALLHQPDLMLEYGSPLNTYEWKDGSVLNKSESDKLKGERSPALWLGIVGRNGIWPVTTLEYKDPDQYVWRPEIEDGKAQITAAQTAGIVPLDARLGLIHSYLSPFGMGFLLLIGIICLIPSVVLLTQLLLFKLEQEDQSEGRKNPPGRSVINRIFHAIRWLIIKLGLFHLARQAKRGRMGRVFGDEPFYRYRFVRRVYLMACCAALLTIALFTSGVSILPSWMHVGMTTSANDWWQHLVIRFLSYVTLICILIAFVWLFSSVCGWAVGGRKHIQGAELAVISLSLGLVMIGLAVFGLEEIFYNPSVHEQVFFFLRSTEMASGVSLLTPMALIGLASFITFFSAVRRINLAERMACLPSPQQTIGESPAFLRLDHEKTKSFVGLAPIESRIREFLCGRGFSTIGALLLTLVLFGVYGLLFLAPYTPTVDGKRFDLFFKMAFFIVPLLLIWSFVRFIQIWMEVRKLLRRLSWHPLFAQFATKQIEEKRFEVLPAVDLLSPPPTFTALSLCMRQAQQFYCALAEPLGKQDTQAAKQFVEKAKAKLSQALLFDAQGDWQKALVNRRESEEELAKLSQHVSELLETTWDSVAGKEGDPTAWHNEGKFFLIAHVTAFLQHVFAHLQNLVALVTTGLLLALLASNSYPFQPRQPLLLFSWATILTVAVVTTIIFVQMSRDRVMSLLSGTTPGKLTLTRDFVVRLLIHGIIPVVALLGAQFPETLRQIFSWLSTLQGGGH